MSESFSRSRFAASARFAPLAALVFALSAACGDAPDHANAAANEDPASEMEAVSSASQALSLPKASRVRKVGKAVFDEALWGAGKVNTIASSWLVNVALDGTATQSSEAFGGEASRAIDGVQSGVWGNGSVTHTAQDAAPWWELDLGSAKSIEALTIWNRTDCCADRLASARVEVLDASRRVVFTHTLSNQRPVRPVQGIILPQATSSRYVRITGNQGYLSLAEVEVWQRSVSPADGVCWKRTYGRGAGTVPTECPGGDRDAGLCYPKCEAGYVGVGPVCWQSCAPGYTDDGALCRRDAHITSANNSACPWYDKCGLTFKKGCSTCPEGYRNDGCTCRRDVHVYAKHSYGRGVGTVPQCRSGLENDAGLCYASCRSSYNGVGPVCWGQCPADYPVACGAACATSKAACGSAVADMVIAPLNSVASITSMVLTMGGSSAATAGAKTAVSASAKATLKATVKSRLKDLGQNLAEGLLESTADALVDASISGEFPWASLDPTGIADVVMAFNQPICGE